MSRAEEYIGWQAVGVAIGFNAFSGIFTILRCVARFGILRNPGPDDVMMIFSWLCSTGSTVTIYLQSQHALGRHLDTVSQSEYQKMLKPFWVSLIFYHMCFNLTKLSLLLQYLRFFPVGRMRIACWTILAIVLLNALWAVLGNMFLCWPVAYFWNRKTIHGHCIDIAAVWFASAALNIVTDLAIYILPLPVLKTLHLPKKQKYGLIGIFAIGLLVCITSIIRFDFLYFSTTSFDKTWLAVRSNYVSSIELNLGIVCACLPTLRPLLARLFPQHIQSSIPSSGRSRLNSQPPHYARGVDDGKRGGVGVDVLSASADHHPLKFFKKCRENERDGSDGIHIITTTAQEVEQKGSKTGSETDLVWDHLERNV